MTGHSDAVIAQLNYLNQTAKNNITSDQEIGQLAMGYHSNLFYDLAEVCYLMAAEINPDRTAWLYYLALIKEEHGETLSAIKYYRMVVERTPDLSIAWFKLGNSYLKKNLFDYAEQAFRQALNTLTMKHKNQVQKKTLNKGAFPLEAYIRYESARVDLQRENFEPAKEILEELINTYPTFSSAYRALSKIYYNSSDKEKGLEYQIRAGDFKSYMPPADYLVDNLLYYSREPRFILKHVEDAVRSENIDWAIVLCNHILKFNPNEIDALIKLIMLNLDVANYNEVTRLIPKFLELSYSDYDKLMELANYLIYRAQYLQAARLIEQALKLNQSNEANILYVRALRGAGYLKEGIKHSDAIILKNPTNVDFKIELAILQHLVGNEKIALQLLSEAVDLDPDNEITYFNLGKINSDIGNHGLAMEYFSKSIELNPNDPTIQLSFGNYLIRNGFWKEALEHFQNALVISPNNIDFIERSAWILATSPDDNIRNGSKALELSNRLTRMRMITHEQIVKSWLTKAVAHAEMDQFDIAVQLLNENMKRINKTGLLAYTHIHETLLDQFKSKQKYSNISHIH
jgi:tetratricopeptide (TPR) repeat protein